MTNAPQNSDVKKWCLLFNIYLDLEEFIFSSCGLDKASSYCFSR